ncbi:hypothetical protein QYF36_002337 [Acer negundo]|nr:hypothetical protein QYF36_002337 [Acer negundo]
MQETPEIPVVESQHQNKQETAWIDDERRMHGSPEWQEIAKAGRKKRVEGKRRRKRRKRRLIVVGLGLDRLRGRVC